VCKATDCPDEPVENSFVDVTYTSDAAIYGFQFDVEGADLVGASGGDAAGAGFTVSTGNGTVLGFSFSGGSIPAGSGVLTTLEVSGDGDVALANLVLSGEGGSTLDGSVDGTDISYGAPVATCDDDEACNTGDEGDCAYAEDNYDCDGNCTAGEDCAGDCGGSAVVDECGDCGGDGAGHTCTDGSVVCDPDECADDPGIVFVDVHYDSDEDIYGFQFNVGDDAELLSASGGDAEAAGFTVSTGNGTVLGFSFSGGYIPAGSGVLTTVEVTGDFCIPQESLVLSGAGGSTLDGEVIDCLTISYGTPVDTCDDDDACIYWSAIRNSQTINNFTI
jgi:hypothetical protein